MKFYKIPQDAFAGLQVEAGMLLTKFDPVNPTEPADEDILCATTGGINASCVAEFSDYGEDVDNVPNNMMEFKRLVGWTATMSFTSLGTNNRLIKFTLGAADQEGDKVSPRSSVKLTDFSDLWWVGEKANEGFLAIHLFNALSTGGFSLQTSKGGKGQISVEITGHVSIKHQDVVPMEFYSSDPAAATTYTVTQNLTNVESDFSGNSVNAGEPLTIILSGASGYDISQVSVQMGGADVTGTVWDSTQDTITIDSVTGNVVITATGEENP
ncbi:MAG: hypothetical protein IJP92_00830 [Lachnospiraceae bacterium]|nr:hypothetical protein [Lachnospiraceae bacterium]